MTACDGNGVLPCLEALHQALLAHSGSQRARDIHDAVPRATPQFQPAGVACLPLAGRNVPTSYPTELPPLITRLGR